jgi:hypothetical protein
MDIAIVTDQLVHLVDRLAYWDRAAAAAPTDA